MIIPEDLFTVNALRLVLFMLAAVLGAREKTCIFENMLIIYVNYHVICWVGVGWMLTFLALADMLDATQDGGLGWVGC